MPLAPLVMEYRRFLSSYFKVKPVATPVCVLPLKSYVRFVTPALAQRNFG